MCRLVNLNVTYLYFEQAEFDRGVPRETNDTFKPDGFLD
jgi:hypothetical protein